jgi:hypothetical protein
MIVAFFMSVRSIINVLLSIAGATWRRQLDPSRFT